MSDALTGYLSSNKYGTPLTDGRGKDTGWRLRGVVGSYSTSNYESTSAVVLFKPKPDLNDEDYEYAGGYWLGPDAGDLFRGEVADNEGEDGLEEAEELATSESDYWYERDAEAAEEFEREQEEELRREEGEDEEDY